MLSLRRPSAETIGEFLAAQSKLGLTYPAVGATAAVPPAGYAVDHTRIKLGEGEKVFSAAKAALGRWDQFRLGWVEAWSPETPIETGEVVAVIARLLGLWWLNACRIVYVVDEAGADPAIRVRLWHAPRPCRDRRGAVPHRMGPGERGGLVRHPGLLPAPPILGPAGVSVPAAGPEAIREGVSGGDGEGREG